MIHIYALHQRNHLPLFCSIVLYGWSPLLQFTSSPNYFADRQLLSGWLAFLAIMGHCIVSINCLHNIEMDFKKESHRKTEIKGIQ